MAACETRPCSVCGSLEKRKVFEQRFITPSAGGVHGGYDVVICKVCGFAFADNMPEQSFLDSYYTNTGGGGTTEAFGIRHQNSLENVVRYVNPGDRILEIGCGTGEILGLLAQRGYGNLMGLEPGEESCRIVKERYGVECARGIISDKLEIGRFDFLILSHVLEHIIDAHAAASQLHRFLNPGGRVYIEVPDANAFALLNDPQAKLTWDFAKDLFAQFCPEHVNFFTPASLHNLMRRSGFQSVFLEPQVSVMGVVASVWAQADIEPDVGVDERISAYVRGSQDALSEPAGVIDRLVRGKRAIFVWGAGLHTQRLLANTRLYEASIIAFIDSNAGYHGQNLLGKPIVGHQAAVARPDAPILISSRRQQEEIARQILQLGLQNEVLRLYASAPGTAPGSLAAAA